MINPNQFISSNRWLDPLKMNRYSSNAQIRVDDVNSNYSPDTDPWHLYNPILANFKKSQSIELYFFT